MANQDNKAVNAKKKNKKLAYGAEPSHRNFRLRLARYKGLGEAIGSYVREKSKEIKKFRLLDVGAGSGRSMRFIEVEGVADLIDFHGLDIKQRRLDSIYNGGKWRLSQGDIQQKTPFESACFDILICEQVLEHLNSPSAALDEIARVLKPGGLLILGVPTFPWGISHLRKLYVAVTMNWFGIRRAHVQTFDLHAIKRLVSKHFNISASYGFRIISGGLVSPLEDFLWWYKFNRWLGRTVPFLCTEVQILAVRKI